MNTKSYPSDLSDAQWNILESLLPSKALTGRPREYSLRTIVNATLYILYEGCRWRSLPQEYPPWQTVYSWFARWRKDGTLEAIRVHLVGRTREAMGRKRNPSAAIIDTQSVKTASYAHQESGYDAAKKIKGRKRSILTDTQGFLLAVVVCSAATTENDCGFRTIHRMRQLFNGIHLVWADGGFKNTLIFCAFILWRIVVKVVPRPEQHRFVPLKKRWIVERTFAWLSSARRLAKDYERRPDSHEAFVELAMIRLLLRRLAKK
jgi:transposase